MMFQPTGGGSIVKQQPRYISNSEHIQYMQQSYLVISNRWLEFFPYTLTYYNHCWICWFYYPPSTENKFSWCFLICCVCFLEYNDF